MSNAARQVANEYRIIAGADTTRSVVEIFGSPDSSCSRDFFAKYAAIALNTTP